jgi:trk system potassium uptake protein TrkH
MNLAMVLRIFGLIVTAFSLTMLPPIAISLIFADGHALVFVESFFVVLVIGLAMWLPVRNVQRDLRLRDGFLVVALFWSVLGVMGAVPFWVTDVPVLSFTDSVFEAVSGFTTTGATVIVGLDELPKSILWYRQQIQWLGGVGIIVLAVALFPMLGIGGMQLYKAEMPGPVKEDKMTPRIAQTAKALWGIYVLLTLACAFAYGAAGMDWFDAICHAFTTVATAGFSTHDASLAYFDSYAIDAIACVFMFLGGVNFALHFTAWRSKSTAGYFTDPQFRAYLWLSVALVLLVFVGLYAQGVYPTLSEAFRYGLFQAISHQTTTGFVTANYSAWPGAIAVLLLLAPFIGGCAGSTAGGMKVIRWQLVLKQGVRELKRLVHPSAELPVKYADKPVPIQVLAAVTGFFAMYLVLFGAMMLLLMTMGIDQVTAWSAVASGMNNLGPGLGDVHFNYTSLPDAAKWVVVVAMLIGRLEVFTLLVLFTPAFWRR